MTYMYISSLSEHQYSPYEDDADERNKVCSSLSERHTFQPTVNQGRM